MGMESKYVFHAKIISFVSKANSLWENPSKGVTSSIHSFFLAIIIFI